MTYLHEDIDHWGDREEDIDAKRAFEEYEDFYPRNLER